MNNKDIESIDLGGQYSRTCLCGCEISFKGRRNQKFLDTKHKAIYNNEKAAKLRETIQTDIKKLEANLRILRKHYSKSNGEKWIHYSELLVEGFDPNGLFYGEKDKKTGMRVRRIGEFAFSQSEDNRTVIIYKK